MNLTPVTTPKLAKSFFPDLVWDLPSKEKVLYLTFDDGPTPIVTDWTLDVLKQYNAKATFFCIGKNVEEHPTIFKRIVSENHSVGNHTYNHLKGWKINTKNYLKDIEEAQEVLNNQIPNSKYQELEIKNRQSKIVNLFRPPYGQIRPKQAKHLINLGYKVIMWNVLAKDWDASITEKKCFENVVSNASSGDIIVFHDSIKAKKNLQYALPRVLEYYSEKGFKFKRIP
ncbi:polysaccharide deacetylase family protein [Flavobacteriaceae bacterium AH-315-B10]|nr:polysaccharide deacetylase family protein [Flavobacteriaceae bacterium AH-315-B10]